MVYIFQGWILKRWGSEVGKGGSGRILKRWGSGVGEGGSGGLPPAIFQNLTCQKQVFEPQRWGSGPPEPPPDLPLYYVYIITRRLAKSVVRHEGP